MHYIRFLKSPSLRHGRKGLQLQAKITVTTDLGESFLCFDLPLLAILIDSVGNQAQIIPYQWKLGNRELDILFSFPSDTTHSGSRPKWPCKLLVEPRDLIYQLHALSNLLLPFKNVHDGSVGLVLSVWSEKISIETTLKKDQDAHGSSPQPTLEGQQANNLRVSQRKRVVRQMSTIGSDDIYIWEETGESIARHIWDAGIVLSAFLMSLSVSNESLGLKNLIQKALATKEKLGVLELGTGCGIVGITMAQCYPNSEVLITDLPEAEDIATCNIHSILGRSRSDRSPANIKYQNLDWAEILPENLQVGNLDLILVADCTYNSDVVPDLVNTLDRLLKYNKGVLILVAMKIRHDSETVFFELMKQKGIIALERLLVPLPLLGQGSEEIEIHIFTGN